MMREPREGVKINDEFSQIRFPEMGDVKPHPMFLAEHRQLNGFNND